MSDDEEFTIEPRIPTDTIVGAAVRHCNQMGNSAYIIQKGDQHTGLIMIIHHIIGQGYRLLMQSRDMDGVMGWMNITSDSGAETLTPDYTDIHPIIERAKQRDPDLWIVELETKTDEIPFEGKIIV